MGSLGPRALGWGGREVREGPPKPIALPPFARTGPEAQPSRGFGRDRQAHEEDKGDMESGGSQATRTGRLSNPSVRGGELRRGVPAEPPPRLPTAPPTMAVLLSWARQASTKADPFGGPGRGRCWVGGAGGARGVPGSGGESSAPAARRAGGLSPRGLRHRRQQPWGAGRASAGGGAALGAGGLRGGRRLPRREGATGRMDLGLWLISAWGAAICSRRLFGGLAEGGTGVGAGRAAVQPGRYFLKMSCSGPGRYLMTVSRMLSSSSSAASPQPGGMAFLGLVRLPSELASRAAWASASRSSFFLMPYCGEGGGSARGPRPRPARLGPSGPRPALLRPRLPGTRAVSALPHGAQILRPVT